MHGSTRPRPLQITNGIARLAGVAAASAVLAAPGVAFAEVGAPQGTVQQAAADALFLQYAPAPPTPGVVCLIDSGVDPDLDTTPILAGSTAIDGSADTSDELAKLEPPVQPGTHASGHGTTMAMVMAAPQNGWGMVGIAPTSVRVYSVKALRAGRTEFGFADVLSAMQYCTSLTSSEPGLSVINLSLAGFAPSQSDLATFQNDVAAARNHGLNVVAAAGNDAGPVSYPAAAGGVFAVGGADANPANLGVMCPFSNRGPQLQVLGPACGTQADPVGLELAFEDGTPEAANGTSAATAQVSAVIASMRAYNPSIGVTHAEQCVTSTEVRGGNLDTAAAFRACGLGTIVDQGNAAYQAANTPPSQPEPSAESPTTPPDTASEPTLPRPRLAAVNFKRRTLSLRALNLPAGARMRVSIQRRGGGEFRPLITVRARTFASARAALRISTWDRLLVRYLKPGGTAAPSPDTTVTPARHSNWNTRPIEFLP